MIADSVKKALVNSSWIREMFEKGVMMKQEFGAENVFDFSLGNPVLDPAPQILEKIKELANRPPEGKHRYMPNLGYRTTRVHVAQTLSAENNLEFDAAHIAMSVGAGGGLNVLFKALVNPGDEILTPVPYFVEYAFYAQNHQGVLTLADTDKDFQLDLGKIEEKITQKTRMILINSPNNPTGAVYSQDSLNSLGELLRRKEDEYQNEIYLVSDEPYRKILFDGVVNASVFQAHDKAIMVTSHSKDLCLAGERIGFVAMSPKISDGEELEQALAFTTRILGFVNAPAFMQNLLPLLDGIQAPIIYEELRDLLYDQLTFLGFEVSKPQGAFFMFPKSPIKDDVAFVNHALDKNILLVPGRGFGKPGYFRIAFCGEKDMIKRSFVYFKELARDFGMV